MEGALGLTCSKCLTSRESGFQSQAEVVLTLCILLTLSSCSFVKI